MSLGRETNQWVSTFSVPSSPGGVMQAKGLAWEANNTGWNSSYTYNSSAWTVLTPAMTWADAAGSTPFYARFIFTQYLPVSAASFTIQVDDSSQTWVNGQFISALSQDTYNVGKTANILPYLRAGTNVIAVKGHNQVNPYTITQWTGFVDRIIVVCPPGN